MSDIQKLQEYANQNRSRIRYMKQYSHSIGRDFFEGLLGFSLSAALLFPFEQLNSYYLLKNDQNAGKRREPYAKGIPNIVKQEGVKILFKGILPICLKNGLYFGSNLAIFHLIKGSFFPIVNLRSDVSFGPNLSSGMISTLLSYLIMTPVLESGLKEPIKGDISTQFKNFPWREGFKLWKYDVPIALFRRALPIGLLEVKFKRDYYRRNGDVPFMIKFFSAYSIALFTGFIALPFE